MAIMIFGLIIFVGIHLIPALQPLRKQLFLILGERGYKAAFSIVALTGLVLIVIGKSKSDILPLYQTIDGANAITTLFMFIAVFGIVASHRRSNLKRFTAHPMSWGIICWAIGHLIANGDVASVILFTVFLCYSLFAIWSANSRGQKPSASGSVVSLKHDLFNAALSVAAFTLLATTHEYYTGVPLI